MEIVQIGSYSEVLNGLLLSQYQGKPNFKALIDMFADQCDDLEVALFELRDKYYLSVNGLPSAEGVQLDNIGKVFNVSRLGMNDTDYREAIQVKALSRLSGTPDDLIFAARTLLGAADAQYIPAFPAGFYLFTSATISPTILEAFSPAGVGVGSGDYLVDQTGDPITPYDGSYIYVVTEVSP